LFALIILAICSSKSTAETSVCADAGTWDKVSSAAFEAVSLGLLAEAEEPDPTFMLEFRRGGEALERIRERDCGCIADVSPAAELAAASNS
jgi:hypothetical protein